VGGLTDTTHPPFAPEGSLPLTPSLSPSEEGERGTDAYLTGMSAKLAGCRQKRKFSQLFIRRMILRTIDRAWTRSV
jgi:hypothetical protein